MNENKEYISQLQENGALHISEDVVASIAGMAALETEGVSCLGNGMGADLADILGKKNLGKGIRITAGEDNSVSVDCTILLKIGFSIVEVSRNVQNAIISNLESTTGLKVSAVNVTVSGIALPKDNKR